MQVGTGDALDALADVFVFAGPDGQRHVALGGTEDDLEVVREIVLEE